VRHTPLLPLVGLSLSIFNAYADISLAMYGAMVEAAEQVFEAVGIDKAEASRASCARVDERARTVVPSRDPKGYQLSVSDDGPAFRKGLIRRSRRGSG